MMANKLKPLTRGERNIINLMAGVLVCLELEVRAVAPQVEKSTGKKYDHNAPDSYLNTFFNNNPEYKRAWKLLLKDKASHERGFLKKIRGEHGE